MHIFLCAMHMAFWLFVGYMLLFNKYGTSPLGGPRGG